MIVVKNNGGLVDVTLNALNQLTHAGAFARAGACDGGQAITPKEPPPSPYTHGACHLLVFRMCINPRVCTIDTSPGLDLGTEVDVTSTEIGDSIGGAITQAANSVSAGNPAHFGEAKGKWLWSKAPERGSNAKIVWNPFSAETLNFDGVKSSKGMVAAYIVLAHELSHADRMMRGTSLVGVVGKAAPPAFNASVPGTGYTTMVDIEHIEMVGFTSASWICKDPDVITENQMRAEHNVAKRVNY